MRLVFSAIAFIAHEVQYKHCMKLEIPCVFQLSSQGHRNDLNASTDPNDAATTLMKSADVLSVVHDGQVPKWMACTLHPNLWILMGDLSMRTRVFTITIVAMDVAATVVLNQSLFRIQE